MLSKITLDLNPVGNLKCSSSCYLNDDWFDRLRVLPWYKVKARSPDLISLN